MARELLRLGHAESFGTVADVGCGRGQFAGLLLEAGLAPEVTGFDCNERLLGQARRAFADLTFRAVLLDLTHEPALPHVDTVLLLDVLYQLPTAAQLTVLARATDVARRLVVIRTLDTARGARAYAGRALEHVARLGWPQAGGQVNPLAPDDISFRLVASGFAVERRDGSTGTPFANVLLIARRR